MVHTLNAVTRMGLRTGINQLTPESDFGAKQYFYRSPSTLTVSCIAIIVFSLLVIVHPDYVYTTRVALQLRIELYEAADPFA
jgi:hypothetical protein